MSRFIVHHHHEASECGAAFASFRGHDSPLRDRPVLAACPHGGHAIWWDLEAEGEAEALALLPYFVAVRSTATQVGEVDLP